MLAKEIKPGSIVEHEGSPVLIESVSVQSPSARGAATLYKFRGRNLVSQRKTDLTLKGTESLAAADFQRRPIRMMFRDATHMHFLDQQDYNTWTVDLPRLADQLGYITDRLDGMLALVYQGECVGVQLPAAVDLEVVECEPAARGNSATARSKPARLETGLIVQVPDYLKQGERIQVDTRTGEFLSRG